jgi:UPF0716 protein FxsA
MLRLRSQGSFMRQPLVRLPVLGIAYLGLWLAAELVAFEFVVYLIGFAGAILACILTSLAGLASLRRMSLSGALRLRRAFAGRGSEQAGLSREVLVDGALAGLGAILLILPGFVSDFVGLALAAPSFRIWVVEKLRLGRMPGGRAAAPALIDLTPEEWSRDVDHPWPLP